MGLFILGIIGWVVPMAAGIWYVVTVREIRDEIKLIRRYMQQMADRPGSSIRQPR